MGQETQQSITEWGIKTFGKPRRETLIARLNKEMEEILELALSARRLKTKRKLIGKELADLHIVLVQVASAYGVTLHEEVDGKMIINRNRAWVMTGKGVGQHVKGT